MSTIDPLWELCYHHVMDKEKKGKTMKEYDMIRLPRWEQLPEIDLYLEQVLLLLDKWLGESFRHDGKKLLTKTMINNYVKQHVISPPVNKRYHRISIASLFAVCILKSVYRMEDITKLIHLALEVNEPDISYNRFCDAVERAMEKVVAGEPLPGIGDLNDAQYLLQVVAQSFACTFFARSSYLSKV